MFYCSCICTCVNPALLSQVLEAEVQSHESLCKGVVSRGQELCIKKHPSDQNIQKWVRTLKKQWTHLKDEVANRKNRLHAAIVIKQVTYFKL